MCGRYSLSSSVDELVEVFDVSEVALGEYRPRYNIAPTHEAPLLVRGPEGIRLGALRWGLIPHWADDPRVGNRMINARSETVATAPAFRDAFRARRCLIPADGFYEWAAEEVVEPSTSKGRARVRKVPYWIHRPDRRPFTFAGLWERWRSPEGERIHSFTILTTPVSERLRPLHDRMPVVIPAPSRALWLDPTADPHAVQALLRPSPDASFEAWPVAKLVNSPGYDGPACTLPLTDGKSRFI